MENKYINLEKICRLCLCEKKDLQNIFGGNLPNLISEISTVKVEEIPGWPNQICTQCLQLVSRASSFKKRIEKADFELKNYIKSLTIIVEPQPESQQMIIQMNPPIFQAPNFSTGPQFVQLIVQPTNQLIHNQPETLNNFIDEQQLVTLNGQQTILNFPHQVQSVQQQIVSSQQEPQSHQEIIQETDEIEVENFVCENFVCEDEGTEESQFIEEESLQESSEIEDNLLAEFMSQQQFDSVSGKFSCQLCHQEFSRKSWLESHFKNIHQNWIKANCKRKPTCLKCGKSFRGPGMLKMHEKTHEKENKLPNCTICGKEFKSKSILYRHRATHFSNQKSHFCEICNKNFSSKFQLTAHRQRHEKNEKQQILIVKTDKGCSQSTEEEIKISNELS